MEIKEIAHIRTPFNDKFGIPRQSGMADIPGRIVFCEKYRAKEALRGIEGFSHLWIIWGFSQSEEKHSLTVRPPRLGGNKRVGVFATRSPYRPKSLGLSSVRLTGVENTHEGTVLLVEGVDMADGTPVYDIKPYLSYTDSHPDARGSFADDALAHRLNIVFSPGTESFFTKEMKDNVCDILSLDPRPSYQDDPQRIYGVSIYDFDIRFTVDGDTLTVKEIKGK